MASGLDRPIGLTFDAVGNLYVAAFGSGEISQVDLNTGALTLVASGLTGPAGIAFAAAGDLYVAEQTGHRIVRVNLSGNTITTVASGLSRPIGLTFDAVGNLYVTEQASHEVSQVSLSGGMVTPLVTMDLSLPAGLAFDAARNLYVAERGSGEISQVDLNTGEVTTLVSSGLSAPYFLAFLNGTLYVTEISSNEVSCVVVCPTVSLVTTSSSVCGSGQTALTNWQNQVVANAPASGATGPAYSGVPIGHTDFSSTTPNATYDGDGCTPEIERYYAYYTCTSDNSFLDAGSFEVTIYPDINQQNNVVLADGECCPFLQLACSSGYTVTNTYDDNGATPDCSTETGQNDLTFTVSQTGTSCSATYTAAYNCLCYRILTAIADTQYLCQTGALDSLNAVQTGAYQDDNSTLAGINFWLDNAQSTNPISPRIIDLCRQWVCSRYGSIIRLCRV